HGGETKFGVAKNANPDLNISTLTYAQAKDVYYKRYWIPGHSDSLSTRVSILHFDGCVNNGLSQAAKFLQRAAGVTDDGAIGSGTLKAANSINDIDLCNKICDQRRKFYENIIA